MSPTRSMPLIVGNNPQQLEINRDSPPPTPLLNNLLGYWENCRGGRAIPARADLDPLHIPRLLSSVMLIDVLRDPLDFRYRLIGTRIVERLKSDYTGIRFSELGHTMPSDPVFALAAAIAQEARPGWVEIPYLRPHHLTRPWIVLATPLSDDGHTVNMLLYGADFEEATVANGIK